MRRFARAISQYLQTYYALMLEYRAEIFFWVIAGVLPFILMGVWVRASEGGTMSLSPVDFKRYFISVFVIRQLMVVWVVWEFEFQVVEGRLSPQLLRPIDPVWSFLTMHISEQLTRIPFWASIVAIFFLFNPDAFFVPSVSSFLLAVCAIIMAFALRFAMGYTSAMLNFWVERASAIEQLNFLPFLFLSGMIAPLALFPPGVRRVADYLPYPYFINFPANLLRGDTDAVGQSFAIMAAWLTFFIVLNRILWRRGLKHYSAMGA